MSSSCKVTINYYAFEILGKKYSNTVGVVDLGGGSVQMAYAISEEDAAKAPKVSDGEDKYVKEQLLKGSKYYLYAHIYLNYGLLAGRAEIFKAIGSSGNPCILTGYDGFETVTYMLQADFTHQGFAGHKGTIKNLDVKWMSA